MRICYFGTYERDYPRNALLIAGLRRSGAAVHECHEPVWELWRDKSGMRALALVLLALRLVWGYARLALRYGRAPAHDVVIVGYLGQLDMPLAWLLSRLRGVPVLFNPMLSLYDTVCGDRALVAPASLLGRALWLLDHLACRLSDLTVLDTEQHADYFARALRLPRERFGVVPIGADSDRFAPQPAPAPRDTCEVLFVGKLIPLHGSETIVRAAALLRELPIHFTLVGSGQQGDLVRRLVGELALQNVTLVDWVDYAALPACYAQSDICLGIFGGSAKAARVVPNKVFQALAAARPVITADTPAIRASFAVGEELLVCPPDDPAALAGAIARLAADPALRERVGAAGRAAFAQRYDIDAVAAALRRCLGQLVPGASPDDQMEWGAQPEFYGPRHRFRENYLLRAVRRHATGPRILDAACGAGTLARRLAAARYQVMGLDLSAGFLGYLNAQQHSGLKLLQGDITRLPYPAGSLDGVVAGEVLEHLEDDEAALAEFQRALRPGGVCAISVPAEPGQWDWHDNWAGHVRRYTRGELREKLGRAGFDVVAIHHFGFPFTRAFHRYVYLPRYRRKLRAYRGRLDQLSTGGWRQQAAVWALLALFQLDNLFNRLPLGIGLIAVARKPPPRP